VILLIHLIQNPLVPDAARANLGTLVSPWFPNS